MNELELMAAVVHGKAAAIHAAGAVVGPDLDPRVAGVAVGCHVLGLAHNGMRGQWRDFALHVVGLFALATGNRAAHAIASVYDAGAARAHWRKR